MIDNIPVIDVTRLEDAGTRAVIDEACRRWGFFQVIEHGIDTCVLDAVQEAARLFFAMPKADKEAVMRSRENPWGYYDQELTKNTRDWKEIFDYGPAADATTGSRLEPQWPAALPEFREALLAYYDACESLAFRLLAVISQNLGMPPTCLEEAFEGHHSSFLRLNFYPRCPEPEHPEGETEPVRGHLGLNRHTDAGALTLLLQDEQPGLEVLNDGGWHLVQPVEGALTINVGDIVQVWSNDRYKAAVHRVIANPEAERLSIPFFLNPRYDANYRPLPSTVDSRNPPLYREINWGSFRARRAAGDFEDQGEEIQISHYRTANEEQPWLS